MGTHLIGFFKIQTELVLFHNSENVYKGYCVVCNV